MSSELPARDGRAYAEPALEALIRDYAAVVRAILLREQAKAREERE